MLLVSNAGRNDDDFGILDDWIQIRTKERADVGNDLLDVFAIGADDAPRLTFSSQISTSQPSPNGRFTGCT